jgi:ABC-type glycerol-3-phosphate transport system substrate-binding protein
VLDIITGRTPDILAIPRGTPMDSYISKGVLIDLYPYLDADETVSRADLQANILSAFEKEGRLYSIPISYRFRTMTIPTSIVGERNKWNLEEMMTIADSYLPDSLFFQHESKAHVLYICLKANTDYLISTASEGQSINRELLTKILTFANRFAPSDRPDFHLADRAQDDGQLQCACCELIRGSWLCISFTLHLFGEPFTYIGYPSETGNGNLISSDYNLAISAACEDKEAAWRFISSLLTEKNQLRLTENSRIPLLKSAMEIGFEETIKREYSSNFELYGRMQQMHDPSERDMAIIRDVVENADMIWSFDTTIHDIIFEEADKYFSGGKSVEETVDVIENRLRMYISEKF